MTTDLSERAPWPDHPQLGHVHALRHRQSFGRQLQHATSVVIAGDDDLSVTLWLQA